MSRSHESVEASSISSYEGGSIHSDRLISYVMGDRELESKQRERHRIDSQILEQEGTLPALAFYDHDDYNDGRSFKTGDRMAAFSKDAELVKQINSRAGDDRPDPINDRAGDDRPEHRKDSDYVHKPDLSQYESDEHLEYLARLASHDQQLNGWAQPDGPQGTIFLQVLLDEQAGGKLNGQSKIFLEGATPEETAQRRKWFFDAMKASMNPETGNLDGHVLSQSIVDSYYDATGKDISSSINQADHRPASTDPDVLFAKGPGNPEDPDFIKNLERYSGWSKQDIAYDLLWGHAQVFSKDGRLTDEGVRDFLEGALSGKDENTSGLIHMFPEIEQAARRILSSEHPADELNELYLKAQSKQFGIPLEEDDDPYKTAQEDNDMQWKSGNGQSVDEGKTPMDRWLSRLSEAAATGNPDIIRRSIDAFGKRFQSFANRLINAGNAKDEKDQSTVEGKQHACPFVALQEKFGGRKAG